MSAKFHFNKLYILLNRFLQTSNISVKILKNQQTQLIETFLAFEEYLKQELESDKFPESHVNSALVDLYWAEVTLRLFGGNTPELAQLPNHAKVLREAEEIDEDLAQSLEDCIDVFNFIDAYLNSCTHFNEDDFQVLNSKLMFLKSVQFDRKKPDRTVQVFIQLFDKKLNAFNDQINALKESMHNKENAKTQIILVRSKPQKDLALEIKSDVEACLEVVQTYLTSCMPDSNEFVHSDSASIMTHRTRDLPVGPLWTAQRILPMHRIR